MLQPASQSWEALLRLELHRGEDRTGLVPIERYGPLSVQRAFYPERDCCHVYLLHPPGGVVGGDRLELQVDAGPGAQALFTTPGAAKFYLSAGATAVVEQTLRLGAGAGLEYLPQENIYFPGARVHATTSIETEAESRFALWEKHCFGRPAIGEFFATGRLRSRIELRQCGRLVYTETQRIDAEELRRASGLRGYPVCGTLLAGGLDPDTELWQRLLACRPDSGVAGATRPQAGLIAVRYLGPCTSALDDYFVRLWEIMRPALLRRDAVHPRIWKT